MVYRKNDNWWIMTLKIENIRNYTVWYGSVDEILWLENT